MRPVWLLAVAVVVVGVTTEAVCQCLEHPSCQEVTAENNMLECIQLCCSDLPAETPAFLSDAHLRPLPQSGARSLAPSSLPSSSSSPQAKSSYSMEHFRWGKPIGRKRRPVTSNGVEEDSAEVFPREMRRRELASKMKATEDEGKVPEVAEEEQEQPPADVYEKKDGTYKMKHFRWSGPPDRKRHSGFVKSRDERSRRPLLTLLRNIVNKDGREQK
ncbi:pro-opiomelanocortin-like [Chelmon rostratus]|uniref:pro-opiomelanocortin-like n=1 Tax=Chelmon rostratus TaxID=109905 RepID=UPI001BECB41C|nr:pro-opiomelanocortin-like [Chelmon rostratus]